MEKAFRQATRPSGRFRFGAFEADLGTGELIKQGRRVRLQEQPFQLLATLLERPGELVTREELRTRLWPQTTVDFDHGVNKAISKLRDALGDSATNPRFIETVARRGYRFLADVAVVDIEPPQAAAIEVVRDAQPAMAGGPTLLPTRTDLDRKSASVPQARRPRVVAWTVVGLACALAAGTAALWLVHPPRRADVAIRSLAVLPLANFSSDPSQDYFADGMTEELITELGRIRGLGVISRTSVMSFRNTTKPLAEIARELNVDAVVEGSVLRSGDTVRITAQLIAAPADRHVWAQGYEGDIRDVLKLQGKVASAIAEQVRAVLNPRGLSAPALSTSVSGRTGAAGPC